ncbi:MAG: GxxExxY protein [Deltaproteobacteria bacterium]|nr:GxxExxY protein [Deltaproteobacteria bacterium]
MSADKIQGRRQELDGITEKIIGCVYKISKTLGCGFLEKVYENALVIELRKTGLQVEQQYGIKVRYDGIIVGEFAADLLIEENVLLELKTVKALDDAHLSQCLNYLKATGLSVCLLVNFGKPKAEIRRIVNNF